ncbi:Transmembrane protein [Trichinella pseudospiralis]|uniref:Transmembrane protein n=1 Tax=Trichinella pseudospiralis TaxID=6337 RepID=A0A0V1KFZ7_TRIPS|nr:Transmembrane protein [Trichinella pseudospiralis]
MLTASLSSIPETDEHWPNKFSFLSTCNDDNDANKLKQQHNRQSSAPEKARSGSGAFLQLVALLANVAHFRTRHDASLQILRHARRVGVHQSQQELFEAQRRHFKPVKLVSGLADETVVKVHRLFNRLVDDEKQNPLLAEAPGWGVDTAQVAADGRLEATSMHVPRLTLEPEPAEQTVIFGFTRNLPAHLNRKTNLFFFVKNQIYSHAFSFRGAVILISVLPDCSYFEIRSTSDNFECKLMGVDVEFIFCTFIYIFIVLAAVAPPDELYHIFWSFYLFVSYIIIAFAVGAIVYYQKDDWSGHPIVKRLRTYDSNWRNVAAAIDEEYKDMEKFLVGLGTTRVIVTNNWIILIDAWSVHLINQRDAVLCVSGVDTYDRSSSGLLETQYVNIRVASVTNPMKPFTLRINSLLFVDLLSKLTAPIHHVTDLNIPVKIEDRFQIIFEHTANSNLRYDQTQWQAEECCIGCFQCVPLVKLLKNCKNDDAEVDEEGNVLMPCSPCLSCMGKWFVSRQDFRRPRNWTVGRSPCPTCRAPFCLNDVCLPNV